MKKFNEIFEFALLSGAITFGCYVLFFGFRLITAAMF